MRYSTVFTCVTIVLFVRNVVGAASYTQQVLRDTSCGNHQSTRFCVVSARVCDSACGGLLWNGCLDRQCATFLWHIWRCALFPAIMCCLATRLECAIPPAKYLVARNKDVQHSQTLRSCNLRAETNAQPVLLYLDSQSHQRA